MIVEKQNKDAKTRVLNLKELKYCFVYDADGDYYLALQDMDFSKALGLLTHIADAGIFISNPKFLSDTRLSRSTVLVHCYFESFDDDTIVVNATIDDYSNVYSGLLLMKYKLNGDNTSTVYYAVLDGDESDPEVYEETPVEVSINLTESQTATICDELRKRGIVNNIKNWPTKL